MPGPYGPGRSGEGNEPVRYVVVTGPAPPDITRIRPTARSRDDIPAILTGIQDPCGDEGTRKRLFGLPGRLVLPGKGRRVGRPGMEPLTVPVPGVVKRGPGCGFDRLREPANQHIPIRRRPKAGPRIMGRGRIPVIFVGTKPYPLANSNWCRTTDRPSRKRLYS